MNLLKMLSVSIVAKKYRVRSMSKIVNFKETYYSTVYRVQKLRKKEN